MSDDFWESCGGCCTVLDCFMADRCHLEPHRNVDGA